MSSYKVTFGSRSFGCKSFASGTWRGKGRVGSVVLMPRWLPLWFVRKHSLVYDPTMSAPSIPGAEYAILPNFMHYTIPKMRLHYTVDDRRMHYRVPEE